MFFIAIPLVLQLAIFANYSLILDKIELLAREEYHSKSIVGRCHWISVLVLSTTLGMCSYVITGKEKQLALFKHGETHLPVELAALSKVVSDDAKQEARVGEATKLIGEILSRLSDTYESTQKGQQSAALAQLGELSALPVWATLIRVRHDIFASENDRFNLGQDLRPSVRSQHREFIAASLAVNVLAAAALFFAFTVQITSRLATLSDNVVRFGKRQELNPVVSGKDEVAQLDVAFHDMANALKEAEGLKQRYLQMLSHDLRTPLTAIVASLSLLALKEHGLKQAELDILDRAERNAETLLNLINELLEIERTESGAIVLDYRIFDFTALCAEVADSILPLAVKRQVHIKYPNAEQYMYADPERIRRVLANLLGNALKFSRSQSTITVTASESSEWVEVKVQDQGVGIPPEFLDKVFDRFQQVRKEDATERGGTGLGLAICKAIVEAHGGQIGVNSTVGAGSEFWFRIPLPAAEAGDQLEAPH